MYKLFIVIVNHKDQTNCYIKIQWWILIHKSWNFQQNMNIFIQQVFHYTVASSGVNNLYQLFSDLHKTLLEQAWWMSWQFHYKLCRMFLFQDYGGTLEWSGLIQSYILASFYWAYIVSQIVGGLATQKLGTKRVFGYAQLATALCSLSIPWASETHFGLVIGLRFIQGFASVSICFFLYYCWLATTFSTF